jgi:outer membrane protein assembly factor BamB
MGAGNPGCRLAEEENMKRIFVAATLVATAVIAGGTSPRADSGDWAGWRGPNASGVSTETGFVDEWHAGDDKTPAKNIKWKSAIPGSGHSSPVIWGDRIFLTTSIKGDHVPGRKAQVHLGFDYQPGYVHPDSVDIDYKHQMRVLGLDAKTGKILWNELAFDGLMEDDRHRANTFASSTIATDGTLVYAFFESLGLYAYDFNGKLAWKTNVGRIIKAGLGPGTSPVLYKNLLIIQADQEMGTGSSILALDKTTGKEVWRTERSTRRSWATPLIVEVGDRTELVASGAEVVTGYDPNTGKELWRADGTSSHPIPSPVAGHGLVYLSAGSSAKRAFAVKLGGTGDLKGTPSIVWRYNKGTAYVASPILYGPYFYLMTDTGLLTALDALTGEMKYEGGRVPVPATFRASIVAFDGKLLLTSEDGDTFIIKAGPVHEVLRTNSIGEVTWASPALSRGVIYIRGDKHLYAIGK